MIGLLSAFGLWIGMMLGWTVKIIVMTTQKSLGKPSINATLTFTSRMVFGTVIGAAIGSIVLFSTSNIYIHLVFLLIFAILMPALSGVNTALQIFLALFIIIILNIIYSGQANFTEARVFDVALGRAISLANVYILDLKSIRKYWTGRS